MTHSMHIDASFDSGNIVVIGCSGQRAQLQIREDRHSAHFQWFHFVASGLTPGKELSFELLNAGASSYPQGWAGYLANASYDGESWFRVPTEYLDGVLRIRLTPQASRLHCAYFQPYGRDRHQRLIERALAAGAEQMACGRSVEGRALELLRFGSGSPASRKLWVIAQQHPGEHMAEWFVDGMVSAIETASVAERDAWWQHSTLYLLPNMNPDGAYHGNLRTNAAGTDLNRAWQDPNPQTSPEVLFVLQQMRLSGVDLFLDIHGDEAIPHVFAAGCEGNPGYSPRLAQLEQDFRQALLDCGAEFQTVHGYPRDAPGSANPRIACNAVGQAFDCLSLTIEMPFKDHDDRPQLAVGWNGPRSMKLGQDTLAVALQLAPALRP